MNLRSQQLVWKENLKLRRLAMGSDFGPYLFKGTVKWMVLWPATLILLRTLFWLCGKTAIFLPGDDLALALLSLVGGLIRLGMECLVQTVQISNSGVYWSRGINFSRNSMALTENVSLYVAPVGLSATRLEFASVSSKRSI